MSVTAKRAPRPRATARTVVPSAPAPVVAPAPPPLDPVIEALAERLAVAGSDLPWQRAEGDAGMDYLRRTARASLLRLSPADRERVVSEAEAVARRHPPGQFRAPRALVSPASAPPGTATAPAQRRIAPSRQGAPKPKPAPAPAGGLLF